MSKGCRKQRAPAGNGSEWPYLPESLSILYHAARARVNGGSGFSWPGAVFIFGLFHMDLEGVRASGRLEAHEVKTTNITRGESCEETRRTVYRCGLWRRYDW